MSLHITISVNRDPVERIRIDRRDSQYVDHDLDPVYVYDVIRYGLDGRATSSFPIEHRYADGAVELAALALDQLIAREQGEE